MSERKSRAEIDAVLNRVDDDEPSKYPGMTYEQGISEALLWVLGDLPDEEFEYAMDEL